MSANLSLANTTGENILVNCTALVFMLGDVGRVIRSGAGRATVETFTDANTVRIDIIDNFSSNAISGDDWYFQGSGNALLNPNKKKKNATVRVTSNSSIFRSNDEGKWLEIYGGTIKINQVVSNTIFNGTITSELKDSTTNDPAATDSWSIRVSAWNEWDGFPSCGCFYGERMYLARDQSIWGSSVANFESFSPGSDDDDSLTKVISDDEVNEIVAIKGLNALQILTRGGEYSVAPQGGNPLSPTSFNVLPRSSRGSAQIAPVRIGSVLAFVQTGGRKLREFTYSFEADSYKSPDMLLLADHLTKDYAITMIGYAQEPDSIIYALREDGVMLCLVYQREEKVLGWARLPTDGEITSFDIIPRIGIGKDQIWISVNRTVQGGGASANITTNGSGVITSTTIANNGHGFASAPTITVSGGTSANLVAVVNANTILTSITLNSGGTGYSNGTSLSFSGGNTHVQTYIEYSEEYSEALELTRQWPEMYLDSAVIRQPAGNNIIGLSHLEGKTIRICGDGQLFANAVVTNGRVPRDAPHANTYEIGLPYEASLVTLEPIIPESVGGAMMPRGYVWAGIAFRRALGLFLQGEDITFRESGDDLEAHVPLKQGKKTIRDFAFGARSRITVESPDPLPAEVMAIFGELRFGDQPEDVLEAEEEE